MQRELRTLSHGDVVNTGSALAVPPNVSRAQYIRDLFGVDRTRFLLMRRRKTATSETASAVLDALVAWDSEQTGGADTHQLSVKYNELLDGAV